MYVLVLMYSKYFCNEFLADSGEENGIGKLDFEAQNLLF